MLSVSDHVLVYDEVNIQEEQVISYLKRTLQSSM